MARSIVLTTIVLLVFSGTALWAQGLDSAFTQRDDSQERRPLRIIHLKYADPAVIAQLFGGSVIWGDTQFGRGSGYDQGLGGSMRRGAGYQDTGRSGGYGGYQDARGRTGQYGGYQSPYDYGTRRGNTW